jgi:peroxiredoxin Q/BCP
MTAFQKDIEAFERRDTQVLGVSPDDVETHQAFAESLGLTFPLLVDPGGAIQSLYGPGRVSFFIDKKGLVRYIEKGMPDNQRILREIDKLFH